MSIALVLARLLLAAVFLVAGLAKLVDLAGSRQALWGSVCLPCLPTSLGCSYQVAELAVERRCKNSFFAWIKGGKTAFPALLQLMRTLTGSLPVQ
jgi:hypothetical protein